MNWFIPQLCCALFVLVLTFAAPTHAQILPGVFGTDDREIIESRTGPWPAVGHVNVGGHRSRTQCTGTLIAPDRVVTAAHCVQDQFVDRINFLAGMERGDFIARGTAQCIKSLVPTGPSRNDKVAADVSVIILNEPLDGVTSIPVLDAGAAPTVGDGLIHASYPKDRRYLLSGHKGCQLTDKDSRLWLTDCDTNRGSSGGPVLIETDDGWRLAAVMAGVVPNRHSVAVPATTWGEWARTVKCD